MGRSGLSAKAWLALIAVYIIWGSTYLAIRVAIRTVPPLLAAGTRWCIAGSLMLAFGFRNGAERPTLRQWRSAAIIGTALCLGGNGLVSIAEKRISSGMAALLVATVPLFVALFDRVVFRARLKGAVTAGLVIGFAGVAVLVRPQHGSGGVDTVGALIVLGASAAWAAGSLYARHASLPERPAISTGMEMICGGVSILIASAAGGEFGRVDLGGISWKSGLAIAYLVVFGSLIAFSAYVWMLKNVRTSIVTTYAYVNPLVAVVLGWAILNETFKGTVLTGGAIIIAAVAIIVASGAKKTDDQLLESPDLASEEIAT